MANHTTQQERDALAFRALQLIAVDDRTVAINGKRVVSQLVRERQVSVDRAHSALARALRVMRGAFVRGRKGEQ